LPHDSCKRMPEIDLSACWDRLPDDVKRTIIEAARKPEE